MEYSLKRIIGSINFVSIIFILFFYWNVFCIPGEILDDRFNADSGGGPLWRFAYNFSIKSPFAFSKDSKNPLFYELNDGIEIAIIFRCNNRKN